MQGLPNTAGALVLSHHPVYTVLFLYYLLCMYYLSVVYV